MGFFAAIIQQTLRNLGLTWRAQALTLLTVTLSVLIFSFFFLIYTNALKTGQHLDDDLRLVVYLEESPPPALKLEYERKILKFDQVEKIEFVSSEAAYSRFREQLGPDADVLEDMPHDFLPPSIEVYPVRSLENLTKIKRFSEYLLTLPGVLKVQYGKEWIERFYAFIQLMRIVVLLSGTLLILTTTFMVAHTIRLTMLSRLQELEILRLIGATNKYISLPFFLEGVFQGLLGSSIGLAALFVLFNWIKLRFAGSALFAMLPFSFFSPSVTVGIIAVSTLLCASGSLSSTRKIQHL
ncbi:MAG: cell division protein FtsX [Desulfobulbus propionicus]|nr:MAG: cell division protein FtsX [Desulfobulbus propionicus]